LTQDGAGFSPEGVLSFQFFPSRQTYPTPERRAAYVQQMLAELSSLPGVASVGSTQASFGAGANMQSYFDIEGRQADPDVRLASNIRHVTPGYFTTLHVPMRAGRPFTDADRIGNSMVAVVSESFARQFWPGESAVGKRIRRAGPTAPWLDVVGVAADVRDVGLATAAAPTLYVPYLQQNTPTALVTVVLRTQTDPSSLATAVRRAVWRVDRNQALAFLFPLEELLARSVSIQHLQNTLLALFAAGGLSVALVGLYGLASSSVVRRHREIGIRAALGARRGQILGLVVGDALRPVAVGIVLGLVVAVALALYATRAYPSLASIDLGVFAAAAVGILVTACVAAVIPSSRALQVDPAGVLREE